MAVPATQGTLLIFSLYVLYRFHLVLQIQEIPYNTDLHPIPNMDALNGRRLEDDVTRIELPGCRRCCISCYRIVVRYIQVQSPSPCYTTTCECINLQCGVT
jgi:hypothetical protein